MIERTTHRKLGLALLLAAATSCSREEPSAPPPPPLIVVGVDGLEWDLVLRFMKEGVLPNLRALAEEGFAAKLDTLDDTKSPLIWTTIATGMRPEKHGITDFSYVDQEGRAHLFTSMHRRSKALWNHFSERGLTTDVYGWWCTFPAEEIAGEMVAQTTTRGQIDIKEGGLIWKGSYFKGLPKQVWPEELAAKLDAHAQAQVDAGAEPMVAAFGKPRDASMTPLTQRLWGAVWLAYSADLLFRDAALDVLREKRPFDALLVYFGVPDVASHQFWRHFEPGKFDHEPPREQIEDFGHVIRDSYRFVDAAIGEIRRLAPDADLLVISDHGFHEANVHHAFGEDAAGREDSGHHMNAPPGVLIARGQSFKTRPFPQLATAPTFSKNDLPSIGRVEDVLPTLLARVGIPYGEDMDGRPLRGLLADDLLRARPITSVKSHEDAAWRRSRQEALEYYPKFERDFEDDLRELDDTMIQRLRQIGYGVPDASNPDPPNPEKPPEKQR